MREDTTMIPKTHTADHGPEARLDLIEPFVPVVSDDAIADLKERLQRTRLPEHETVDDWSQGVPLDTISAILATWRDEYDWRRLENELALYAQAMTRIDGLGIHFLHARSTRPDARPLLITHGWPGSIVEFLDLLPGLIDPPADQPAFHVVLPSLPGYGFSEKPSAAGWGIERIADAWAELMPRLGYPRFLAQGGDWGAMITTMLALRHPDRVAMLHTPVPWAVRPDGFDDASLSDRDRQWLDELAQFRAKGGGYAAVMSTRPQSFGYGLVDSPVGQLVWILEAYMGHGEKDEKGAWLIPRSRMLDNASYHWFSASGASAARLYWESLGKMDMKTPVVVPTAVTIFPKELMKLPREWTTARYPDLRYWNVADRGGHHSKLEVPEIYLAELRAAFVDAPR
jgi:pimeloyl-ACP methyl ester carboxylesterase